MESLSQESTLNSLKLYTNTHTYIYLSHIWEEKIPVGYSKRLSASPPQSDSYWTHIHHTELRVGKTFLQLAWLRVDLKVWVVKRDQKQRQDSLLRCSCVTDHHIRLDPPLAEHFESYLTNNHPSWGACHSAKKA